jgi:uncharacterized membrane protein YphA (DoxX/SURF4 family)
MLKQLFSSDDISVDLGLLLVRLGVGLSVVIFHGYDKLMGGPTCGPARRPHGACPCHVASRVLGFHVAFAESICSCLLIVGMLFRPAALLLACNMAIAVLTHLNMPVDSPMRAGTEPPTRSSWGACTSASSSLGLANFRSPNEASLR